MAADRDCKLRGLWGWFLDWLPAELARLRARCDDALPGWDAEVRHAEYVEHLDLMAWAAEQVERLYLEDRRKVVIDWGWDRGQGQEARPAAAGPGEFEGGPDPAGDP